MVDGTAIHTKPGSFVNLERRCARAMNWAGIFVDGHVEGVGKITRRANRVRIMSWKFARDGTRARYVILKGSIAIEGIQLRMAGVGNQSCCVRIHSHTLRRHRPCAKEKRWRRGEPGAD